MFGKRIKRARAALGLSLRDLADQVDLSHAAIKKYEDDLVVPSSDILIKLGNVLHVKVEYFFRPEHFTFKNIQYRKHADMPEKHLQEITAKVLDQIERRVELENLFPVSPIETFSIKKLSKKINRFEEIELMSENLRQQWRLGLDSIPDLINLFEEKGIKIVEIDNDRYPKIDGFCATIDRMPIIVVGNHRPGDRQRFTLVHELGHLLLDNQLSRSINIEEACNRFAGAFLLPKKSLTQFIGEQRNHIEPRELNLLKQEFGISMTGILHRLKDINIIGNKLYSQLRGQFNERGWSKIEPGKPYPNDKPHIFEQMVFHALAEGYIGESKAAELMNMTLESFRSLRAMESWHVGTHQ